MNLTFVPVHGKPFRVIGIALTEPVRPMVKVADVVEEVFKRLNGKFYNFDLADVASVSISGQIIAPANYDMTIPPADRSVEMEIKQAR